MMAQLQFSLLADSTVLCPPLASDSFSPFSSLLTDLLLTDFLLCSNTLLCTAVLELLGRFNILDLIRVNCVRCHGLVKKSPSISCVGQYAIFTLPFLILSVTKKYLMSRCQVLLLLDVFPFSTNRIVLSFSW